MNNEKSIKHIGIVMDGNGRWAKSRGLPRIMGHHAGARALERTVRAAKDFGIKYLSVYAFSTENWKRPKGEVIGLMGLFRYYMRSKLKALDKEGVRVRFAGCLNELPDDIQNILHEMEDTTKGNTTLQFIACLNYGGQKEIIDAVNKMLENKITPPVTSDMLRQYLYLPDVPNPDLLIRTSGELRMSNFWLWQGAYSEYYFTDKFWPDFGKEDLEAAITDYYGRERRYGKS